MSNAWNLESFLDALILELDKAQDTLAVKGVNRKLTYMVKDLAIDLNIFPEYKDGKLEFKTAKAGDTGSSKISFQLGSITDRQIKETTSNPIDRDDVSIDAIEDIDEDVKASLTRIGVQSVKDLEKLERSNVNVERVVQSKANKNLDYDKLAQLVSRAKRKKKGPLLNQVKAKPMSKEEMAIELSGENLVVSRQFGQEFPKAYLNKKPVKIEQGNFDTLSLVAQTCECLKGKNTLEVALDPYAIIQCELIF